MRQELGHRNTRELGKISTLINTFWGLFFVDGTNNHTLDRFKGCTCKLCEILIYLFKNEFKTIIEASGRIPQASKLRRRQ
jgi:hypothetical protein